MSEEQTITAADVATPEPAQKHTYSVQVEMGRPAVTVEADEVKVEGHGIEFRVAGKVVAHFRSYAFFTRDV